MKNYDFYINEFNQVKNKYQGKFLLEDTVNEYINYYKEIYNN